MRIKTRRAGSSSSRCFYADISVLLDPDATQEAVNSLVSVLRQKHCNKIKTKLNSHHFSGDNVYFFFNKAADWFYSLGFFAAKLK